MDDALRANVPMMGMSAADFRRWGHQLVDWLADLHEGIEDEPVVPNLAFGDLRAMMAPHAPEQPEDFADVVADLDRVVAPGLVHWQSPNFFAWFPSNVTYPSILADLVSAGLGQQGMIWASSPITTELELHVLDWLVELLGLPESYRSDGSGGGVIQMSASDSTHTALVVARERVGVPPQDCVAYTSAQAHSSIEKGAGVAGYGHVRLIDVDEQFAMRSDVLAATIAADVEAGLTPTFVCAAIGTTATTAVDPLSAIADVVDGTGAWLHVDAAYAGSAMICPELRHHQAGVERADSYTWNPHKWLGVGFDCSVFHVRDRGPLLDALSITPAYLRNSATDSGAVDLRDWHVPLGRRFRALKLWFVLRTFGAEELRAMIRRHVALAQALTDRVVAHPDLELFAPTTFGLVCFAAAAGPEATMALADEVNADRRVLVTPSTIGDVAFVRVSIGHSTVTATHVDALWDRITQALGVVLRSGEGSPVAARDEDPSAGKQT